MSKVYANQSPVSANEERSITAANKLPSFPQQALLTCKVQVKSAIFSLPHVMPVLGKVSSHASVKHVRLTASLFVGLIGLGLPGEREYMVYEMN